MSQIFAIDPARLVATRGSGQDEHGNPLNAFPAEGGEPLRCCLRRAAAGEAIALISHTPFTTRSPWTETGPVYIHYGACGGYPVDGGLPEDLRTGPKVLRSYRADNALDYEHIALVPDGEDVAGFLAELLAAPEVATVHVRTLRPQCFLYEVTR